MKKVKQASSTDTIKRIRRLKRMEKFAEKQVEMYIKIHKKNETKSEIKKHIMSFEFIGIASIYIRINSLCYF